MSNNINACFISYRHPGDPGADRYVQAFVEQLKTHLALYLPNPSVFFDQKRLGVGDFFDPKLAYELCRSACMIIFFSPCHFDPNHPYCAMEYKTMVELEKRRLDGRNVGLQHQGLIFPIVFRGSAYLPKEICDRQFENFENVMKWQDFQQRKYKIVIDKLAGRIFDCYQKLHQANVFDDIDCTKFYFQDKDDIMPWINKVAPLRTMPR